MADSEVGEVVVLARFAEGSPSALKHHLEFFSHYLTDFDLEICSNENVHLRSKRWSGGINGFSFLIVYTESALETAATEMRAAIWLYNVQLMIKKNSEDCVIIGRMSQENGPFVVSPPTNSTPEAAMTTLPVWFPALDREFLHLFRHGVFLYSQVHDEVLIHVVSVLIQCRAFERTYACKDVHHLSRSGLKAASSVIMPTRATRDCLVQHPARSKVSR